MLEKEKKQRFSFGFSDSLLAELGGVKQDELHSSVDAIYKAYESIKPLAERMGVKSPKPRIAGFCYPHVVALGAEVVFAEDSEPNVKPLIHSPEEIDSLKEPEDYLTNKYIQERLRISDEIRRRYPDSPSFIGHLLEGPITTAVLLMGNDFLMLPYDDSERAHKLLQFCVKSALNYAKVISKRLDKPFKSNGFPDDFAGMFHPDMFRQFVVPYWEQLYQGLKAIKRSLHSELLRIEHLPFLEELKMECFDPGADQYLTPEQLKEHCPCKFQSRILSWHIHDLSADELEAMYLKIAKSKPYVISFSISRLEDESKIKRLLNVAREMEY
ncbi:hypothetical protein KKC91_00440 [bacterium]|nr:hypothetical protein [bacterium]